MCCCAFWQLHNTLSRVLRATPEKQHIYLRGSVWFSFSC
nr:MAG TPA: hypothetical protein [Caudoviricetes sp.]